MTMAFLPIFPIENKLTEKIKELIQASARFDSHDASKSLKNLGQTLEAILPQVSQLESERTSLQALADIGQVINSSLELEDVLRIVMDTIIRLTGAERGFLMLREAKRELVIHIARNWEQETISASEFEISRTVIDRVVKDGQAILTTNAQEDPRFGGQQSVIAYSLRSILCVPLKVKDVLTGVIYADNRIRSGIFTERERDLLSGFANQAAVAIENARLFASVRRSLAEVTELKNLMDNVFASIASGVITADGEDHVMLCNQAAQSLLGKDLPAILGSPLTQVFPPVIPPLTFYTSAVRGENKSFVGVEIQPNIKNREHAHWSLNLSPLRDTAHFNQGIAIVLDDLTEKKRMEAQRRMFEKMLSPAVISQLDPLQLQMGGKRTKITTLFTDIRGFTSFSEKTPPELLVSILNRYLGTAADVILSQEGTIDKFMGDAVMAWFNAPIPQADHTLRAVRAALGVGAAVEALHKELPQEYHLSFGAGIHYGDAVLGLIGSEERMEYTAIGDSINTAKRIQENSPAGKVLISAEAYQFVRDKVRAVLVEPIHAKGKSDPIQVLEILSVND